MTERVIFYLRSSSGGTSIWSETYFPFFFRWRTHSVNRYSICPFTERKAAMVSNLLVVLCGNRDAQPIVNSGSLY